MFEFMFFVGFFFAFMIVAIKFLCPAVLGIWLWALYFFKPFLLKEVILCENCVIVRYRILGDIRLGLENLALIGEGFSVDKISFPSLFWLNRAIKDWQ